MALRRKYRDILREVALDQYGYVTTKDAQEAGVPPVELPKLAARGGLESVAYGLYRVSDIPPSPNDQFAEALLRAGEGAYLYGVSVLALLNLGDVNPRKIQVAVRHRTRASLPPFIELTHVPTNEPATFYEGLASQPIAAALLVCRSQIETERLLDASKQARSEGYLTRNTFLHIQKELRA